MGRENTPPREEMPVDSAAATRASPIAPAGSAGPVEREGENLVRVVPRATEEETVAMERRRAKETRTRDYFPRGGPFEWLNTFGHEMGRSGFPIEFNRLCHDQILVNPNIRSLYKIPAFMS